MGEAKRRGTKEERVAQAIERNETQQPRRLLNQKADGQDQLFYL
jgi:hypothetical protein